MRVARVAATIAALLVYLTVMVPAEAALREVSIGNYYFQDDGNGSRTQIVVDRGDQIRFTVREAGFAPHDVRVDELNIRSGDMQLFETFTTPPLDVPGTFRLYCNRHKDNPGQPHVTQLVVRPNSTPSTAPPTTFRSSTTTRPAAPGATTTTRAAAGSSSGTPSTTGTSAGTGDASAAPEITSPPTVVAGRGEATDRRRLPPEKGSLADILGRRPEPGPWTRSLGLAAAVLVAMTAAVAFAILRGRSVKRP